MTAHAAEQPLESGRNSPAQRVTIAIDAMSGEGGPPAAVAAAAEVAGDRPDASFIFFGAERDLAPLVARLPELAGRVSVEACSAVVQMADRPREALRRGRDSSMSRALDAVAEGRAQVAVSAGNTAALMAMASLRLKPDSVAARPAIAALWPSVSVHGSAVVLDMGADIKADEEALTAYAAMGAAYAQAALRIETPRIALLNVGSEPTKGRPELRASARRIAQLEAQGALGGRFLGFVEGDQIAFDYADVIVTDGFTGNVALKSAEGAARLIGRFTRDAFSRSLWDRLSALAAAPALRRLKARMDPRSVNGGVFLGLSGLVVKSHGAADAVAFASALRLAARLTEQDVGGRIDARLARLADADIEPLDAAATGAVKAL